MISRLTIKILQKSFFQKSLYNIETREAELQQKIVTLSQERFVNGLVNQLTELAFSNTDLTADNLIKAVSRFVVANKSIKISGDVYEVNK